MIPKPLALIIIMLFVFQLNSQNEKNPADDSSEYDIINMLYGKNERALLYNKFESPFEAFILMEYYTYLFDDLRGHCIQNDSLIYLKDILSNHEISLLFEKTKNSYFDPKSRYEPINSNKLLPSIKLYDPEKEIGDLKLSYVTKPVIINDKAIVVQHWEADKAILILMKSNNKWEIVCRKTIYVYFESPAIEPRK